MRVLIIESDDAIVEKIYQSLTSWSTLEVTIDTTGNLKETLLHLSNRIPPELIIANIDWEDENSLELLNHIDNRIPVICISENEEKVRDSFQWNVIDFLIKPIDDSAMISALKKFQLLHEDKMSNHGLPRSYKKRFIVKLGDKMQLKKIPEIAGFFTEGKISYLISKLKGRQYMIEYTLDELEGKWLNPNRFFRINRQYIISIDDIDCIKSYFNRRLKVELYTPVKTELIVSRDKVGEFKQWLNQ